jgi:hypothetical protein
MGVKLFDYDLVKGKTDGKRMKDLFEEEPQQLFIEENNKKLTVLKEMQKLQKLYFKEFDPIKKKQIKKEIDNIELELIEETVNDEVSKLKSQTKNIADLYLSKGIGIPLDESKKISKLSSQHAQILATFNEIKKAMLNHSSYLSLTFLMCSKRRAVLIL